MKSENQHEQAFVWGEGLEVKTPNLDRLANEGALFTNFYTVAPLCTPSRASFMSGLYPQKTGESDENHGRMDDDTATFAQVLKHNREYDTGYLGKWHLNGRNKPGWGNDKRKFGFEDTEYQFNRGHWKYLDKVNDTMQEYEFDYEYMFEGKEDKHFTTDYLFNQGIKLMERAQEREKPFAFVLSIPDPHPPNQVRQPYEDTYNHMNFSLPLTAWSAVRKDPAPPVWHFHDHEGVTLDDTDEYLEQYERNTLFQSTMQQYFGMVKCIDDNVGKLLDYLEGAGIDEETIIVFTSDHGSMLAEHGKMNKGRPYRTSAGIPFILRYPGKVQKGKIIKTALSSIDFAPSILSLMNAEDHGLEFDGQDFTSELLNERSVTNYQRIRFTFDTGKTPMWAAAIQRQYKLVISAAGIPWLFDLKVDPFEMINFFDDPKYINTRILLLDELYKAMELHQIPLADYSNYILWSTPGCYDSRDRIYISKESKVSCMDLDSTSTECSIDKVKKLCPVTCGSCCIDSVGEFWIEGKLKRCENLQYRCGKSKVQAFCPETCSHIVPCGLPV